MATIHQLPNELLLEIFQFMDPQTLMQSVLVNRNWKQIITQSSSTMRMLPLIVTDEKLENGRVIPKFTRRYDAVTLDEVYSCDSKLLRKLKAIGQHVKQLNIQDCIFFEREFIKLCRCFPNLEVLVIRWCSMGLTALRRSQAKPAELKKLKKLVVWGEGWMLENIKSPRLEALTLSRFYVDDQRELVKFLNAQTSLKSLRLNDISDLFSTRNRREKIVFNLRFHLHEISLCNLEFVDANHLLTLIKRTENCETAIIGHNVPLVVAQEVMRKFHNLTYLYLDADHLTDHASFYNNLQRNPKLKFLKVAGTLRTSPQSLPSFLSVFPNIESLDFLALEGLESANNVLWSSMSNSLKKVQRLLVQRFNVFNMVELKFPLMTSCTIDMLGYTTQESWTIFSRNNPIVDTLVIKSTPLQIFFGADVMSIVTSLRHLEYFRHHLIGPHGPFALH
jgi:F-box-like